VARCNHPNSGAYVATKAAFVREFEGMIDFAENDAENYEECGRTLRNDDQALFSAWIASGHSRIRLDYHEELVLNVNGLPLSEPGMLLDMINAKSPPLIHGPNGTKPFVHRLFTKWQRIPELIKEPRHHPTLDHPANNVAGLLAMLRELPPLGAAAEIGSHEGVSTEALALFSHCVLAVDPWYDAKAWEAFRRRLERCRNVHPLRMTGAAAASLIADGSLDLVYIDADHSYPAVRHDIAARLPKIRRGGFITGHDYYRDDPLVEGVCRAVDERFGKPDRVYDDYSWLVQI
jgi:predicted O-methyltransferase YrrM